MPIDQILLEGIKANDKSLQKLDLSHQQLNDADIEQLVKALANNTSLTKLKVSYNQIGPDGAKALASNTTLTTLNIYHNHIGNEGAKALASNTNLAKLNIGYNKIGDAGARALASNTTLTTLDMYNNAISDEWEEILAEAIASNNRHLIMRRKEFLHLLIILAKDKANPVSQSFWAKLPGDILLYIISLINFTSVDSIGKSAQQIYQCAEFIFENIPRLNESLEESIRLNQPLKIIEKYANGNHYQFQFFPLKPKKILPTEEIIVMNLAQKQDTLQKT